MYADAATSYFSARARQSWRMFGYGALAAPFLFKLHPATPVVALAATIFALPLIWNFVVTHLERNGDKMPTSFPYPEALQDRRELQSLTFKELVKQWRTELSMEGFITESANFSGEYGRRLCVIYVRLPNLPSVMRELVANLLRTHVRKTDEIAILSSDEFIVCAPMLRDALDAEIIYRRLADAIRGADLALVYKDVHFGKAIYPMDGYTGADLIRHSRIVAAVATKDAVIG